MTDSTQRKRQRADSMRVSEAVRRANERGLPATLTLEQWRDTMIYFGDGCAYCGIVPGRIYLDCVVPMGLGGGAVHNNCVPACSHCRSVKGQRNPLEADLWNGFPDSTKTQQRVMGFVSARGGVLQPSDVEFSHYQMLEDGQSSALCGASGTPELVGSVKATTCPSCRKFIAQGRHK